MNFKRLRKVTSFMLTMVFCFSLLSVSAFAAGVDDNSLNIQTIEEAGITKEEAMEVLNLTPEEARNVNFYALKSTKALSFDSGDTYTFPKFRFTDYNVGSYFKVNADKLKYGVIWELSASQPPATLDVRLYPYGESCAYNIHLTSPGGSSQRLAAQSDWVTTYNGAEYHFVYEADAWEWDSRSVTSDVTMILAVL